jgi:hypothetical protein
MVRGFFLSAAEPSDLPFDSPKKDTYSFSKQYALNPSLPKVFQTILQSAVSSQATAE